MGLKRYFTFRHLWIFSTALAGAQFLYSLVTPQMSHFSMEWNREACVLRETSTVLSEDGCGKSYTRAIVQAQPFLENIGGIACLSAKESTPFKELSEIQHKLRQQSCALPKNMPWGAYYFKTPDIGQDAKNVWYARAATVYFLEKKSLLLNGYDVLLASAFDPKLVKSIGNSEDQHYPNLIPFIYASFMKTIDQVHPLWLQMFQVFLLAGVMWLFWKTRSADASQATSAAENKCASRWTWAAFALAPIGAVFAFQLYTDLWLIAGLLLLLLSLDRQWLWLSCLAVIAIPFVNAEAWFQMAMLLAGYQLLHKRPLPWWLLLLAASSSLGYLLGIQGPLKDASLFVAMGVRLSSLGASLAHLVDPRLWGLLWPLSFYWLWQNRLRLDRAAWPLLASVAIIPVMHNTMFSVPTDGRALWTTLPLLWLIVRDCQQQLQRKS